MTVFNITLILHFASFLLFLMQLAVLFPRQEKQLHSKARLIGLMILLTGISLVILKYPQVNFYKIIPKSLLFFAIATVCGVYSGKEIPKKRYHLVIAMTVLASLIAIVKL